MPTHSMKPWIEVVALHPDVISENFSEDIFALDLGPLADGNPNVPAVYRDPEQFFRASFLTAGLRGLLKDVLARLGGGAGNRVLKLITPFGDGKSHTLASLMHAARDRDALDVIPEGKALPKPGKVRTAVFDGQFFDATNGKLIPGEQFRARTMWGWIAWSLGGLQGYELLREQDEARVAPGGDVMVPQAIPQPAPVPGPGPGPMPPGPTPPPPVAATQTTVDLSFAADRDALFTAWNAIANLADMAGQVSVTIYAESAGGFDKGKLNNGVMEPLREADLIE